MHPYYGNFSNSPQRKEHVQISSAFDIFPPWPKATRILTTVTSRMARSGRNMCFQPQRKGPLIHHVCKHKCVPQTTYYFADSFPGQKTYTPMRVDTTREDQHPKSTTKSHMHPHYGYFSNCPQWKEHVQISSAFDIFPLAKSHTHPHYGYFSNGPQWKERVRNYLKCF